MLTLFLPQSSDDTLPHQKKPEYQWLQPYQAIAGEPWWRVAMFRRRKALWAHEKWKWWETGNKPWDFCTFLEHKHTFAQSSRRHLAWLSWMLGEQKLSESTICSWQSQHGPMLPGQLWKHTYIALHPKEQARVYGECSWFIIQSVGAANVLKHHSYLPPKPRVKMLKRLHLFIC